MQQQDLDALTNIIDNYNYANEEHITPESLHEKLWYGFNSLRNAPNKEALMEGWKYKETFVCTEDSHKENKSHFKLIDDWEQSFVLHFWMCIYH
uniref:Uncharacterized protein n=1 Tax=viral metagenome TaxID=1070528 RepID=A0A6C0IIQ1_9ZZZZ